MRRLGQAGRGMPIQAPNGHEKLSSWALAGTGVELAAAVGGMTVLGWWLDHLLATTPWLLVIGALLGFSGGLYNFLKKVRGCL